ncbi:MAG TPA: FxsA family protein [Thermoleophilaceae bacterium]|nr:FxsA family protein [Thermoleophilaceae bacterium]
MAALALIAIFIVVPLAELYVILRVGDAIGWAPTIAILALDSLLGSWLLRSQGRAVWNRFNAAIGAGRVPHREVIDGVLIIFGGAFLITPGFITDVIGLLLLLPPTRAAFRRLARRSIERRAAVPVSVAGRARRRRGGRDYDVEGTASELDRETRRLSR